MLELRNIKKDYITSSETVHALKGLDITFRDKEFVSILGPSGCGKTTLLNIIGGLDKYTSGDLIINGRSTKSYKDRDWDVYRNHRVGFIFQSYNLIPHQTVLGNVELALTIAGISKEERVERAKRALDRVGLSDQYYKRPNQLSGGQCQRVAIARALVNDPEILLADEPTGALDTVTSVQIMNLVKEIAGERLVVMVTHNPELAEEYSTRIVKLLDGRLLEDSNPVTEEEITEANAAPVTEAASEESAEAFEDTAKTPKKAKKVKDGKKERAKMSFFTAFRLSARNLISKKGRTAMVGFAGSIGIIGIAMVLAFSAGIKGYVASMQDDMLSGNPIKITETTYDLNALTGMMDAADKLEIVKEPNKVYINSIIEYIAKMSEVSSSMIIKNDITKEYFEYIKAMPKVDENGNKVYNAMLFDYGLDTTHSIYVDYEALDGSTERLSVAALTSKYTSILKGTDFAQYSSYVTQVVPSFEQAPNNPEYIKHQYDVHGEIATEYDEVMLVLNPDQELTDLLLARLGYYTEEQFYNLIYKVMKDERYDESLDVKAIDYSTLLNKTFTWYPNNAIFTKNEDPMTSVNSPFSYAANGKDISEEGVNLKITGVLIAGDNTTYGCLSSGIYYTEALTEHILKTNADSEIVKYIKDKGEDIQSMKLGSFPMGIYYTYTYRPVIIKEGEPETKTEIALVGASYSLEDMMEGALSGSGSGTTTPGGGATTPGGGATTPGGGATTPGGGATIPGGGTTTPGGGATTPGGGTTTPGGGATTPGGGATIPGGGTTTPGSGATTPGGGTGGFGGMGSTSSGGLNDIKIVSTRFLGGVDIPNSMSIYPVSFEEKDLVTKYLDNWNQNTTLTFIDSTGKEITLKADERTDITYTDVLELVINMINTMIDIISYALIAFTSVSLIVSTVMIGIITYVSVVERIKEIGVIRSLGGRKRDVSNLFVAETFILGLLAGLIGIAFTYVASLIVNILLTPLIGYPNIAALPIDNAIFLVILSIGLTLISGLLPASSAAKKDPVVALRTE